MNEEKKVISSNNTEEKKGENKKTDDEEIFPGQSIQEPVKSTLFVENVRDSDGIPQFDKMTKDAKLTKELNNEIHRLFNKETTTVEDLETEYKKLKTLGVEDKTIGYIKCYYSLIDGSYVIENDTQCVDILVYLELKGSPKEMIDGCITILAKDKGEDAEFSPIVELTQQAIKYGEEDNLILSSYAFKCASYLSQQLGDD